MDAMGLANVSLGEEVKHRINADTQYRTPRGILGEVIWKIASANPHWRVVCTRGIQHSMDNIFTPEEFRVYQGKEVLGMIRLAHYRREYCVGIANKRIGQKLDRGDEQHTKDVAKAISIVKKTFSTKTTAERVADALSKSADVVRGIDWAVARKVRDHTFNLSEAVHEFAYKVQRQEFESYLQKTPQTSKLVAILHAHDSDTLDMVTIRAVKTAMDNGDTCTVVLTDGKYIVKHRESNGAEVYDDANFPDNLRAKLGLLKLVGDGQMVTDVGCRINDEIFVLMLEVS